MFDVLGIEELTIVITTYPMARLIVLKAHQEDHQGPKFRLWRKITEAWIVRGFKLALQVARHCIFCIKMKKILMEQHLSDMTFYWPTILR